MKKLLPLALLATSSFAHPTPFKDPAFLKLSGGDPELAFELSFSCGMRGKTTSDCVKDFTRDGVLKQKATEKCAQRIRATKFTFKIDDSGEVPGSRGTTVSGSGLPHSDLQPDEEGVMHLHKMSEQDKQRGSDSAEKIQIELEINKAIGLKGSSSTTSGGGVNGGLEFGTSSTPAHVVISVGADGSKSTTVTGPLLDKAAKDRIEAAKKYGRDHPEAFGIPPSILCRSIEKNCREGMGWGEKNPNYDPNAKPKETKPAETKAKETKSETKSDDSKKGADNPPKHEEEKTVEVEIEHHEIGKWTGVDKPRNPDDTMIATPMEKSETEKSPLDRCVDDETNLLIRQVGSQTLDPNGSLNQKEIEEVEKSQSLFGYCDVIVMGQEFCRMKKFKEDSVPSGTDLGIEKFEKAAGALDALKMWGQCDKAVLGAKFCKDYEHQWIITPTGFEKIEHETSVKSGDIRHFAPQPDFEVKDEPVRDFTINPNFN